MYNIKDLRAICRKKWNGSNNSQGFWCSFFKVPYLNKNQQKIPILIDVNDVILVVSYFSSLTTFDWEEKVQTTIEGEVKLTNPREKTLKEGTYIRVLVGGNIDSKEDVLKRVEEICGLNSMTNGCNIEYLSQ